VKRRLFRYGRQIPRDPRQACRTEWSTPVFLGSVKNRTNVRKSLVRTVGRHSFMGASSSRPGAPAFADALKFDIADLAGAGRPIIWSFNARNPNPYADP
jgi:hypothetical protein